MAIRFYLCVDRKAINLSTNNLSTCLLVHLSTKLITCQLVYSYTRLLSKQLVNLCTCTLVN